MTRVATINANVLDRIVILGLVISWGKGLKKDHILYLTVNLIQALLKKLVVLKENFILFDYHTETYDAVISSRRDILV
ncbi:MAG: hypothetical protein WCP41_07570 [Verrucomicrobiota bacterium]